MRYGVMLIPTDAACMDGHDHDVHYPIVFDDLKQLGHYLAKWGFRDTTVDVGDVNGEYGDSNYLAVGRSEIRNVCICEPVDIETNSMDEQMEREGGWE